jgi:hypothetical protein
MIAAILVFSVIFAVMGIIATWIMNVFLKMSGGIELRFLPEVKKEVSTKIIKETVEEKPVVASEETQE